MTRNGNINVLWSRPATLRRPRMFGCNDNWHGSVWWSYCCISLVVHLETCPHDPTWPVHWRGAHAASVGTWWYPFSYHYGYLACHEERWTSSSPWVSRTNRPHSTRLIDRDIFNDNAITNSSCKSPKFVCQKFRLRLMAVLRRQTARPTYDVPSHRGIFCTGLWFKYPITSGCRMI